MCSDPATFHFLAAFYSIKSNKDRRAYSSCLLSLVFNPLIPNALARSFFLMYDFLA